MWNTLISFHGDLQYIGIMRRAMRRAGFDVVRWPSGHELGGLIKKLLKRFEIEHVIDVGAHRGEYGGFLRSIGFTGLITSFEPVASSYAELRKKESPSWRAINAAVGNVDERVTINVGSHTALSSVLIADRRLGQNRGVGDWGSSSQEEVQMTRLDTLGLGSDRAMLKTDCQGFDHMVLRGAERSLRSIPVVQFEAPVTPLYQGSPRYHETIGWMEDRGFSLSGIFPALRNPSLDLLEVDVVMIKSA